MSGAAVVIGAGDATGDFAFRLLDMSAAVRVDLDADAIGLALAQGLREFVLGDLVIADHGNAVAGAYVGAFLGAVVLVLASGALVGDPSRKPADTKPMMSEPARVVG